MLCNNKIVIAGHFFVLIKLMSEDKEMSVL
jgi:hypothetical protein